MTLVVVLLAAVLVGFGAEMVGVSRHEHGKVDTYSELVWWLRNKAPWVGVPLLVAVTVLMLWAIPHLWQVIP